MNLLLSSSQEPSPAQYPDLNIDGLIGCSLRGPPGQATSLIEWANNHGTPILPLDDPSGVDATTSVVYSPAIKPSATITQALPKEGVRAPGVEEQLGEHCLADISVPPDLYANPGLNITIDPIFADTDIIRQSWVRCTSQVRCTWFKSTAI